MHQQEWMDLLRFIDEQIEEPFSVDQLAARMGYSPYYFIRMFGAVMGVPVMEYVRRRKLQHAAARVLRGERLLDVAVRFGFSSHEGFTRAFKSVFGTPPMRFRALFAGEYSVPPPAVPEIGKEQLHMQWKLIEKAESKAIGYRIVTQPGSAEIPAFWEAVMADERWPRLMGKMKANGCNYGICIHTADMPEGRMDYMIAFDCEEDTPLDDDMEYFTIPAATYAVFPAKISGDSIQKAWQYAYGEWFPSSGYVYDEGKPDFEVYDGKDNCDIYIPVVKKG